MAMTPTEAAGIVRQAIADGELHTTKPVNRALLALLDEVDRRPLTEAEQLEKYGRLLD